MGTPLPAEGCTLPPMATRLSLPMYVVILIGRKERRKDGQTRGQNKQNHEADAGGPDPRSAWREAVW